MQSSNIPSKIPLPFAYAAGGSYVNPIPTASQIGVVNGRASLHDGFPPLTFTPIGAGGVPPFGADMNGILNEITAIQQWQEAGGFFPYDSTFSTAVGGYPKGAVLQSNTFSGFWTSTAENNTTNPDTGGAGWVPTNFEGISPITISSTTTTLTALQAAYPIIVFSGTLTANSIVIVPNFVNEWIFVNNTAGAYTLTVKTSAGTGITLAQSYSTFAYGDATNVYFANSASVTSFNGRTGTISLNATDVTSALGYVPVNPAYLVGAIFPFAMTTAPSGFLVADGSAISRSTYANLFTAIGTTWGAGNGSTTFNIPDLRGAFIRGFDNGRGFDPGRTFGSYEADTFKSHTHGVTDPGHRHNASQNILSTSYGSPASPLGGNDNNSYNTQITTEQTGISIQNTGATETAPKNYAVQYCIKY